MTSPVIMRKNGDCCKLFAACFYEPEKALFQQEKVAENLMDLFLALNPSLADGIQQFPEALARDSEVQLKIDYAALFVGPFELLAPPYGSVYLEKGKQVLGDTTIAVQRCYEDFGLSLDIHEPADHIAIELEFLYYLYMREADAQIVGINSDALRYRAKRERFIDEFMGWVPDFCKRIETGAQTDFYKMLSRYLAALFQHLQNNKNTEPAIS